METQQQTVLVRRVRLLLMGFIAGLIISGVTAFPLQWELELLARWMGASEQASPEQYSGLTHWIVQVRNGLRDTYSRYPFMAYGTDWLAFAHLVIAIAFVGPLRDPVRNIWVVEFGLIACVLVVPLALICGPLRGIPLGWRLLDCSFGIIGFVPLWYCRQSIRQLERLQRPVMQQQAPVL